MEESTTDSDKFYLSNNEVRNNNDDDALPSTSTSTTTLKSVKKRKARRPKSFVWKFFKKYKCTILLDNQEEEVEKAQCLFEGCDTEYLWSGSTSNLITHHRDTHHVSKESLADKPVK
ncbi:25328_t:CDS:1, partial [Gigaspora rosea]